MKILYPWLREFTDVAAPAVELRSRLSMAGVAVDSIEETRAGAVLDAEITINRPDLLSHRGVAREVAALYRARLKPPEAKLLEASEPAAETARVEIESPDLCRRYTARIIRGVRVGPSPDWLRERLQALGQASINNVVDVTNYVMLELGQPMHAFDLDRLAGRHIVVRRAKPGESLRTLDGVERRLSKDMCLVSDGRGPVAVGGVMGGVGSEISFSTQNLLLESAWFEPISVRRTSKALGLRTEASTRFERGADPELAPFASKRAAQLVAQLAGGEVLAGLIDVYAPPEPPRQIELSRKELLRVMGADVPDREIEEILAALGFAPVRSDAHRGSPGSLVAAWNSTVPSWRPDVRREIDLIEEVARIHGYDKFPARLPAAKLPAKRLPHAAEENRLRQRLVALGYEEIISIPLVDPGRDAIFRPAGRAPAEIANPLSEDASVMRTSGTVSMIAAIEWNLNHAQRNVRLFELGRSYEILQGRPVEARTLTLGATGLAREQSIHESEREYSFADLRGDVDEILALAAGAEWKATRTSWLAEDCAAGLSVDSSGERIGVAGRLAAAVAQRFKLRQPVYLAEFELAPVLGALARWKASLRYRPLPRFPAVERDFSIVLADGATFADIEEVVGGLDIPELRRIEALDLFRGGQLPAGKYSLLVRVTFQSQEATLTEAQLADFSARISSALGEKLDAMLRAT